MTYLESSDAIDADNSFDEDYDIVEVRKEANVPPPRKTSLAESVYDVPRSKISSSSNLRKSQSTFNLDRNFNDRPNFPVASPRKCIPEPLSLPTSPLRCQMAQLPSLTSTDVSRNLFPEEEEEDRPKVSPDFSSQTLRPKKNVSPNDSQRFRPRNKSLTDKQPEEVFNELAAILQRRRQNIESHEKPAVSERPSHLQLPTYSTVNKIVRHKPQENNKPECNIYNNDIRPNQSFLHTFANSPRFAEMVKDNPITR